MASIVYDSYTDDVCKGNIVPNTDTFYMMLMTSSYTANKGTHTKRSDITNEVTGTGYSAGGQAVTMTLAKDTSGHKETMTFSALTWAGASITARYGGVYKHRGGASSADELVCELDFGADIVSTLGNFTVASSAITYQN